MCVCPAALNYIIYVTLSRVSKLQLMKWQEAPGEEKNQQQK